MSADDNSAEQPSVPIDAAADASGAATPAPGDDQSRLEAPDRLAPIIALALLVLLLLCTALVLIAWNRAPV